MNETNCSKFKKRAAALAVASCLSLAPWIAEAAGLGKLTVLSGLGQPLRAEVEIGANRDELAGMTARLAPQDAFRQAGVDFASVLLDLRFSIEKRPNGQSVVKVTSFKPVNEPFLDFLVELNWPAGRLVREYTFLLDPPEIAAKQAARPVAEARVVETVQSAGSMADRSASSRSTRPTPAPRVASEPRKADAEGTRVVRPGETLRKIADETKHDGVSLEQMLVGLFQKNPDAFIGNNVNRLKAGAILGIPERTVVEAVPDAEAKRIYVAQAADWNAYRQKLAATTAKAPAREESVSQSSAGKITAKVEEKVAPAQQGKDQVKVSPTELAAASAAAGKAAAESEADKIAKSKALKEAQDRLALLEKNVLELQKLVEMKNQKLAELQQQTAAKKEEVKPAEPPKGVEAAKPLEQPKLAEVPKPVEPVEPPQVAEAAKPAEVKPPEAPKPVEPLPKTPVPLPEPEPEPEPSFLDSLFGDPLPLVAGGGILALVAGYFLYKRRRGQPSTLETTAAPGPSSLGPNSVFRMTGGQSVDTGNTAPQTGDFSQTGPGTIDTDEVDPVAEADVYMAYGRDTQAEEILLEALQKDPQRTAIHAKLLEIYANRRSLKQFETLASELYAQTGGLGAEWEKVAALGASLDPENPLYSASRGHTESFDPDATMIASPDSTGKATLAMPGALAQMAVALTPPESAEPVEDFEVDTLVLSQPTEIEPAAEEAPEPEIAELTADADIMSLDFDLGSPSLAPEIKVESESSGTEEPYVDTFLGADASDALDFDLGGEAPAPSLVTTDVLAGDLHMTDDLAVHEVDFDLPVAEEQPRPEVTGEDDHDFSPEGTLVMPPSMDSAASTYVGGDGTSGVFAAEPLYQEEPPMVDFDLDIGSPATETSINPISENAATETVVAPNALAAAMDIDNPQLASTVVNTGVLDADSLEFDVKLTDSVFLGQPMMPTDFDIGSINLDLAAESPAEAAVQPVEAAPQAVEAVPEAPVQNSQWEEVNTKLDLAKAYEEMGDLEGARELLQEVVGEGPVDLVEQARAILGRIGE